MIIQALSWTLLAAGATADMYTISNITTTSRSNSGQQFAFTLQIRPDYVVPNGRLPQFIDQAIIPSRNDFEHRWNRGFSVHLDTAEDPWINIFADNFNVFADFVICPRIDAPAEQQIFRHQGLNGTQYSFSYRCRRDVAPAAARGRANLRGLA